MRSILKTDTKADEDIPTLLSEKTKELTVVEDYFLKAVKRYPEIEVSYDCTAEEPVNWTTLNYTTYAGCFIMHPLRGQAAHQQMTDAYVHGEYNPSWSDHFNEKLKKGTASKYIKRSDKEEKDITENIECLVVLAGHNKLAKHTCAGSLVRLHQHMDNVYYKKHPISDQSVYEGLFDHLKNQGVKNIKSFEAEYELYDLMAWAGSVATGFASESALYAAIEKKKLICTDLYQNKETAPFYHINWFLFYDERPIYFINTAFNSYMSGIINPEVDKNWKLKIDNYLEYITNQRRRLGFMYVG